MASSPNSIPVALVVMLLSASLVGCSGLSSTTPNARLSADLQEINVGETVNFDARESSTPNPTYIDEYRWEFGDGESRTTKQGIVSHTFNSAGTYEAEVTVVNDDGEVDRASVSIFVNSPPTIVLEMPTFVRAGEPVRLDASSSTDPEGANVEYIWDFDHGLDSDGDGDKTNDAESSSSFVELIYETSRSDLEQGQSVELEHIPGEGARIIQVNATLTLARDLLPIMWPEDNFTVSLSIPETGWNTFASTTHDNITENASASIDRSDMNSIPESDYTITADSSDGLVETLLNEPGERFGQGTWYWAITADECDPDLPVDDVDPDQGNDWQLVVEFVILVPRVSEIAV